MDTSVQGMVTDLLEKANLTPKVISDEMENRVSPRTIYRWSKGESEPQNRSDLETLQAVHQRLVG